MYQKIKLPYCLKKKYVLHQFLIVYQELDDKYITAPKTNSMGENYQMWGSTTQKSIIFHIPWVLAQTSRNVDCLNKCGI